MGPAGSIVRGEFQVRCSLAKWSLKSFAEATSLGRDVCGQAASQSSNVVFVQKIGHGGRGSRGGLLCAGGFNGVAAASFGEGP
jgi:hypothetical protein